MVFTDAREALFRLSHHRWHLGPVSISSTAKFGAHRYPDGLRERTPVAFPCELSRVFEVYVPAPRKHRIPVGPIVEALTDPAVTEEPCERPVDLEMRFSEHPVLRAVSVVGDSPCG